MTVYALFTLNRLWVRCTRRDRAPHRHIAGRPWPSFVFVCVCESKQIESNRIEWNAIVHTIRRAVVIAFPTALISVDYTKCDIISPDNGVKDYLQRPNAWQKKKKRRQKAFAGPTSTRCDDDFLVFFTFRFFFRWHSNGIWRRELEPYTVRKAHIVRGIGQSAHRNTVNVIKM